MTIEIYKALRANVYKHKKTHLIVAIMRHSKKIEISF